MPGLLHIVCAGLRSDADPERLTSARSLAADLAAAPAARGVLVAQSPTYLLVATALDGGAGVAAAGLEAFAASPQHMAFIMRGVAQVTSGMWSAAVETDAALPPTAEALFVFGLRASAEGAQLYEWQVRALIEELERLPGTLVAGPTFEERDRFRAAGALAIPPGGTAAFASALAALTAEDTTWRACAPSLVTATASVIPRDARGTP